MLAPLDAHLTDARPCHLRPAHRPLVEFIYFGIKEARACLFAGLFFLAMFCVPRAGLSGVNAASCPHTGLTGPPDA